MIEESSQLEEYAILATAPRADERTRVIKDGDSFGVFDHAGMIRRSSGNELGLYHEGTRFLGAFEVALERHHPLLLGSTVRSDNVLVVDLANPDLPDGLGGHRLARDTVHVFAMSFLWDRAWYARLRLRSYARQPLDIELSLLFGADYADIFEVRGVDRLRRGADLAPVVERDRVVLGYEGLDRVVRRTHLAFAPSPILLDDSRASYQVHLEEKAETTIDLRIGFEVDGLGGAVLDFGAALEKSRAALATRQLGRSIRSSSARFDDWVDRSSTDLQMMISDTPEGAYPYAGVPWFSTPFGRDGILTAYQTLWLDPSIARGVLSYLALTQATENDKENDAEPGKIIHEVRRGEMAALGEVPFGRYYGSIDATPLFVMLAGAYWHRTADRTLLEAIWPNLERALGWIDRYGDLDGDGLIEFSKRSTRGLASQGWKDSFDSTSHENGDLATGAVALCEVQGYVFAARRAAAELARVLGLTDRARALDAQAEAIRALFERTFWCEDLGTYAMALDGEKRPCRVRSSNAGHCLFSGIASPERARRVVATLLDDRSFSG